MQFTSAATRIVLCELLMLIAGCSAPSKLAEQEVRASEPAFSSPVLFTDKEALQSGTGVMEDDPPADFQETASGLKYRTLRKSDGRKPIDSDIVTVHYRGWLDNGKEFDSSYKDKPISFPLNGVIPGWTEGMQLVGEGGMIELWIPSRLGYGIKGQPGSIPPNANLHFVVELISIK